MVYIESASRHGDQRVGTCARNQIIDAAPMPRCMRPSDALLVEGDDGYGAWAAIPERISRLTND